MHGPRSMGVFMQVIDLEWWTKAKQPYLVGGICRPHAAFGWTVPRLHFSMAFSPLGFFMPAGMGARGSVSCFLAY